MKVFAFLSCLFALFCPFFPQLIIMRCSLQASQCSHKYLIATITSLCHVAAGTHVNVKQCNKIFRRNQTFPSLQITWPLTNCAAWVNERESVLWPARLTEAASTHCNPCANDAQARGNLLTAVATAAPAPCMW